MKKTFSFCCFCLAVIMCFSVCSPVFAINDLTSDANAEITTEIRTTLGDEFMKKMAEQERAVEAYHFFCDYYEKNTEAIKAHAFSENYGGEYIEDGKLYIYYVITDSAFKQVLEKYSDVTVFKKVKYSLDYLHELYEKIHVSIVEKEQIRYEISTKDNCIIASANKTIIAKYRNAITRNANACDVVKFQEVDNVKATTTTPLYGGKELYIPDDSRVNRTISVCGTHNGYQAFATCGHDNATQATELGGTYFFTEPNGNANVGTTYIVAYANNGYGDYSIVRINTDLYNTTNQIKHYIGNYVECSGGDTQYASGQYLIKYGAVGGWAGIRVGSYHPSITYYLNETSSSPHWTIKGLKTTVAEVGTSVGGDSGGPILRYDSNTNKYYYCGVVSGRWLRTVDGETCLDIYFSPCSLMDDDLIIGE